MAWNCTHLLTMPVPCQWSLQRQMMGAGQFPVQHILSQSDSAVLPSMQNAGMLCEYACQIWNFCRRCIAFECVPLAVFLLDTKCSDDRRRM